MCPAVHLGRFTLSTYLLLYGMAFVAAGLVMSRDFRRAGYPPLLAPVLLVVAAASGFVGSRLYFIFGTWDNVAVDPFRALYSLGGTGWYGGLILGGLGFAAAARVAGVRVLRTFDLAIPALPIAQILGRLGCFLTGCCGGAPTNVAWALAFPGDIGRVHPTQLYEAVWLAGVALLLSRLGTPPDRSGIKFGWYLVLAGFGRFVTESYRLNPQVLSFLTVPQIAATLSIGAGLLLIRRVAVPASV